jgi:hypothetical protein
VCFAGWQILKKEKQSKTNRFSIPYRSFVSVSEWNLVKYPPFTDVETNTQELYKEPTSQRQFTVEEHGLVRDKWSRCLSPRHAAPRCLLLPEFSIGIQVTSTAFPVLAHLTPHSPALLHTEVM